MNKKIVENAQKIAFIVQNYPDHKLPDVMKLLQMSAIDINSALWYAQEAGYIGEPDTETGEIELKAPPETYEFGQAVTDLQEALVFCFGILARRERDLEETYLTEWLKGYTTQDVLVAVKDLLNKKVLAEYEIQDPQLDKKGKPTLDENNDPVINLYTFFTLFENGEQLWGAKEFKKNPLYEGDPGEAAE